MHTESYNEMQNVVKHVFEKLPQSAVIVDYGSKDVNGNYRDLISPKWSYLGVDMEAGKNVDHVCDSEFNSGLPGNYADGLICGQVLEHCRNPFTFMKELSRICKPGAFLVITAPAAFPEHKYPVDCWRFLPDGMTILFDQAGVQCWRAYLRPCSLGMDCWGIGKKK